MTTPEKYEKIKEAVFKACFVCETCGGDGVVAGHNPDDPHEYGCSLCPIQLQCEECKATGFLGHEITISSVLRTLGILYAISGNGVLLERRIADSAYYCVGMPQWDLSHDSLSWHLENRPEVVEFLYDILFPQAK